MNLDTIPAGDLEYQVSLVNFVTRRQFKSDGGWRYALVS